jgi:hypothetical protein
LKVENTNPAGQAAQFDNNSTGVTVTISNAGSGRSLDVTGASQFTGNITQTSGTASLRSTTINGTLNTTGNTDLDGTLNVDGGATIASGATITGATNINTTGSAATVIGNNNPAESGTVRVNASQTGEISIQGPLKINTTGTSLADGPTLIGSLFNQVEIYELYVQKELFVNEDNSKEFACC